MAQAIAPTVYVRVAADNPFGWLLARSSRWPLVGTFLLAVRRLGNEPRSSTLPPGYHLQPYGSEDAVRYAAIFRDVFAEPTTPLAMQEWATKASCEAFSLCDRDKVVGFLIAEIRPQRPLDLGHQTCARPQNP